MKERIIGATVLVVVAVLIVPVFLDGPSQPGEIVTQAVTLPGQDEQPRKQQTIVLERDRSQPVPASPVPAGDAAVERPLPEPAKTRETPAKVTAAETAPAPAPAREEPAAEESATGLFAVQLGSFSNRDNAERLAADLRKEGYAAFLSQLDTGDGALHRVRVGPQKDRETAESVAARLNSAGHKGQVVPHP
ncbi:MAG: SPOR domain-containing protein [Gammaproteobacteria bacterium]|nr:SPOR domain-containing protein [Gammaproteobacteria bacterium]MDH4254235.1 SPOR domain-containing protein [Gammaproteobacteria bacterium]MDH5311397.1 SPOR domain-containing protein [Gammaproteobacteria bacterium]